MIMIKTKVLHVITAIKRGGAENNLVDLIQEQIKHQCQVTVAYLKGENYWQSKLESLGVSVIHLGLRYYGELNPAFKLHSTIKSLQPDIIHAHLPPAELYTRIALLGLSTTRFPLIISKHNDTTFYKGFGQHFIGAWVAIRAKKIIAISNAVKHNSCIRNLNCPPEKVATIYYGIDPIPYERFSPEEVKKLRLLWSVTDDTYLIGAVARLVPQKALHILLEGFNLYLKTATKPTKLVVVGTGILESDLKAQADHLGIQDKVIWAGFREDIPVVMNALDLFALTSNYEGLGLVLLEAMSAAKPIVATEVSAIPEVVADGVTGILFPPQDSIALAKAFEFFENDEVRLRFGTAGQQRVKSAFTLEHMINQTLAVYQECIQ
jgi:glycosyltransferase involved in cell wall biosynthesis